MKIHVLWDIYITVDRIKVTNIADNHNGRVGRKQFRQTLAITDCGIQERGRWVVWNGSGIIKFPISQVYTWNDVERPLTLSNVNWK